MINVALAQYAPHGDSRQKTYEHIRSLLSDSLQASCDYLVLPELFSTPYFCQRQDQQFFGLAQDLNGSDVEFLKEIASTYHCQVATTIFEKRLEGVYANTAVTVSQNGEIVSLYRKSHLPQDPCFEEKYYFQAGSSLPTLTKVKDFQVATAICWDQWFPEIARSLALDNAHLLHYPTAIGWLDGEEHEFDAQLQAWLTVTRSHAITNGLYVLCPNRVGREGNLSFWGNSHLTGPNGKTLISFDHQEEGLKSAQIDLELLQSIRQVWPFLRDRRPNLYQKLVQN